MMATKKTDEVEKQLDIYDLEKIPGVGPISAQKLDNLGISSLRDVLVFGWIEVAEATGMERHKAEEAVAYCRKKLVESGDQWKTEMTGVEIYEMRAKMHKYSTSCKALDVAFEGGIEPRAITEFAGKFHSGKTQMSHNLTLTVLNDPTYVRKSTDKKLGDQKPTVLYIDTEDTFRPKRLIEMATERGVIDDTDEQWKELLGRVIVQKADSTAHLISIIKASSHLIPELNIQMVVIDSAAALFRQTMAEMGDAGRKFRMINKMNHALKAIAEVHNIPVIYINQMYDSMDQFSPGPKAYGGNVVAHAMTYRCFLRKKSKVWVATTEDFPDHPVEDIEFLITKKGIEDVRSKKK